MSKNISDLKSEWLFIVPISGLKLTDSVHNELKVGNTIFVSKNKLARIRKRLGIQVPISKLNNIGIDAPKTYVTEFFKSSQTYAVLHFNGIPKEKYFENP